MKVALAQMKMDTDIEKNFQKSLQLICEAAEKKADLICFPEIQLSPFFPQFPDCDVSEYVMTEDNSYVKGIRNACRENHIFASPNFYIEEKGHRYDMSLLIDDQGEIIGRQKDRNEGLFTEFCPKMVANAVDILEEIIEEMEHDRSIKC